MIIIEYIVWVIAMLSTLLLITSIIFDSITLSIFKAINDKDNNRDGVTRTILIFIMAFAWSYIIVF